MNKNNNKITRIHIQGSDNLEFTKAIVVFDRLMKGLEFRFNDSSWVNLKKFKKKMIKYDLLFRYQSCLI